MILRRRPRLWARLQWLRDSRDQRLQWIYTRLQAVGRCDVSDAVPLDFWEEARTLQKNLKCWILFKDWSWWKLFQNSKPLLVRVDYDGMIKELEAKAARG